MELSLVTPLILTFDEEPNIARSLARLAWAREVIVVDSFSADRTRELAASFSNVRVVTRAFDDHTSQWNFGVSEVKTPWVLAFDADYIAPPELQPELAALSPQEAIDAYYASFAYVVFGRPLRASLYPPRAVLFRKDRCAYEADGHTQLLRIAGRSGALTARLQHDDRKPLSRWLASQDRYATLEAEKLLSKPSSELGPRDRLRRAVLLAPFCVFFYTLFVKLTILDGWRGAYYSAQRTLAEIVLSLRLLERRLAGAALDEGAAPR